jgi:hypothetical protein
VIETRNYKDGDPIPPGFYVKEDRQGPLLIAGAMIFGASYGGAAVAGFMEQVSQVVNARDVNGSPLEEDYDNSIPMVIPIAGPFLTVFSTRSAGARTAVLIALGSAQAVGVGMLIASAALPPTLKLVRYKTGRASFSILPSIGSGGVGIGIVGAM